MIIVGRRQQADQLAEGLKKSQLRYLGRIHLEERHVGVFGKEPSVQVVMF